jgi:hypothetical protein
MATKLVTLSASPSHEEWLDGSGRGRGRGGGTANVAMNASMLQWCDAREKNSEIKILFLCALPCKKLTKKNTTPENSP